MKRKILIVEDNVALSQLQRDWLERCGYAVTTAMDEPAAKRVLKAENIALILSDVRLPQGNGIELLEWINREHIHIPFVVMTEYASYPDRGACDQTRSKGLSGETGSQGTTP